MVGGGSPTALHGKTISFIQGVVTVPLKVRILAGAERNRNKKSQNIMLDMKLVNSLVSICLILRYPKIFQLRKYLVVYFVAVITDKLLDGGLLS